MTFRYPSDIEGAAFVSDRSPSRSGVANSSFSSVERERKVNVREGSHRALCPPSRLRSVSMDRRSPTTPGSGTATTSPRSSPIFYLFDSLLGLGGAAVDGQASRWLVELELDAKVQIRDGAFSTTALSQGQRKRWPC